MIAPPIVRLDNVGKYYGPVESLRDITLDIGNNEIVGLIGDNGAGKSTLIKVLTGVEAPTTGDIYIRGRKIDVASYSVSRPTSCASRRCTRTPRWARSSRCGATSSSAGRSPTGSASSRSPKKRIAEHIMRGTIGFRGVGIDVDTPCQPLSGGERQGVAIGRAMHFDSDLIVLDEPTVALAIGGAEGARLHPLDQGGRAFLHLHRAQYRLRARGLRSAGGARPRPGRAGHADRRMSYLELIEFLTDLHRANPEA